MLIESGRYTVHLRIFEESWVSQWAIHSNTAPLELTYLYQGKWNVTLLLDPWIKPSWTRIISSETAPSSRIIPLMYTIGWSRHIASHVPHMPSEKNEQTLSWQQPRPDPSIYIVTRQSMIHLKWTAKPSNLYKLWTLPKCDTEAKRGHDPNYSVEVHVATFGILLDLWQSKFRFD